MARINKTGKVYADTITWQVATGLSHTPHRDMLDLLSAGCSQERVVPELWKVLRPAEMRGITGDLHHQRTTIYSGAVHQQGICTGAHSVHTRGRTLCFFLGRF